MVRNSLNIENRICFDSDSGSGGSDEDFDQERQQDIAMAAAQRAGAQTTGNYTFSDDFDQGSADNQALIGATSDILAADRSAQQRGEDRNVAIQTAERFAGQTPTVQAALDNAMKAPTNLGAPAGNVQAPRFDTPPPPSQQSIIETLRSIPPGSIKGTYTRSSPRTNFFADAYNRNRGQGGLFGGQPRGTGFASIGSAFARGPVGTIVRGVFGGPPPQSGEDIAAMQAGQMLGLASKGMTPEQEVGLLGGANDMFDPETGTFTDVPVGSKGGTLSSSIFGPPVYSGNFDPNYSGPFQDLVNPPGFDGGGNDDGGERDESAADDNTAISEGTGVGQIPSDELAVNFLRRPYYLYSGFGNQYQPYGYAPTTMVDLLQSRGMTQPQQADTLGLFGNPRDFV